MWTAIISAMAISGLAVNGGLCMPPNSADETQASGATPATPDEQLTQRLAQAEFVISGVATGTARSVQPAAPGKIQTSQHNPDWWQATIEVESVEKGQWNSKTVVVLFANSQDIAWHRSPKIKVGEHGIWLLQNRDSFGRPVPGPAVVNPLDFQSNTELERIRTLLKSPKK